MNTTIFAQYNLLFLGDIKQNADSLLNKYLVEAGYEITNVLPDYFRDNYTVADSFLLFDALFISESINSARSTNYFTAGFPIPCVNTEGFAVKANRWRFLKDDATQFKQLPAEEYSDDVKKMVIQDEDHYIVRKFGADKELTWTSDPDTSGGVTGCKLNEEIYEAIALAVWPVEGMADYPCMWAIPEGSIVTIPDADLNDVDYELPNIIHLGIIDGVDASDSSGVDFPTAEYLELIHSSLKWVTGIYTDVKRISTSNQSNLNVWPIPANDVLNISFNMQNSGDVKLNLYDISGKIVKTKLLENLVTGLNTVNIDLSGLNRAHYICEIVTNDDVLRKRISKN